MKIRKLSYLLIIVMAVSVLCGCEKKYSDPMSYLMEINEKRDIEKDNTDGSKDNKDKTQASSDNSKDNQNNNNNNNNNKNDSNANNSKQELTSDISVDENGVSILGFKFDDKDRISNLIRLSEGINDLSKKNNLKHIILVLDRKEVEEASYFVYLTLKLDKNVIVIPTDEEINIKDVERSAKSAEYVKLAKDYCKAINSSDMDSANILRTQLMEMDSEVAVFKGLGENAFDVAGKRSLPRVDIIYDYQGSDGYYLDKAMNYCEGVVVVSTTTGAKLSEDSSSYLKGKGIPPVIVTFSGNEMVDYLNSQFNNDNVAFTNMSPVRARIMLMLLLDKKIKGKNMRNYLSLYRL